MSPNARAAQRLNAPLTDHTWVAPLHAVCRRDAPRVGRTCADLGELAALGIDVPAGFAVTAQAYTHFAAESGFAAFAEQTLAPLQGRTGAAAFDEAAKALRHAVETFPMPEALAQALAVAYESLCDAEGDPEVPVVVRPSTLPGRPAAAQTLGDGTTINGRAPRLVIAHVRRAWASQFSAQALAERTSSSLAAGIGVAVQRLVASDSAGRICTAEPGSGDRNRMVLTSTWGLGWPLVGDAARVDRFVVDKATMSILNSAIRHKPVQVSPATGADATTQSEQHAVDPERAEAPSLTPEEVLRLAAIAAQVEAHAGCPQELGFAVEWLRSSRRIRIIDARVQRLAADAGPQATTADVTKPARDSLAQGRPPMPSSPMQPAAVRTLPSPAPAAPMPSVPAPASSAPSSPWWKGA